MNLVFCTKTWENCCYYVVCQRPSIALQHTANGAVRVFIKNSCPGSSVSHSSEQVHHPDLNLALPSCSSSHPCFFLLLLIKCCFCLIELHDGSKKYTDQQQDEPKTFLRFLSHFWNTGLWDLAQSTKDFGCKETQVTHGSWRHGTANITQISWSELWHLWLWTQGFLLLTWMSKLQDK